jgi:tripeptide aminopeptidase
MRAYERFLEYAVYPTASNEESESCPSTKKQLKLAGALVKELLELLYTEYHFDKPNTGIAYSIPVEGLVF